MPLYIAALGKLSAFSANPSRPVNLRDVRIRADERTAELAGLNKLSPAFVVPYLYPQLYVLHHFASNSVRNEVGYIVC
jgi:hypothetical protein